MNLEAAEKCSLSFWGRGPWDRRQQSNISFPVCLPSLFRVLFERNSACNTILKSGNVNFSPNPLLLVEKWCGSQDYTWLSFSMTRFNCLVLWCRIAFRCMFLTQPKEMALNNLSAGIVCNYALFCLSLTSLLSRWVCYFFYHFKSKYLLLGKNYPHIYEK